MVIAENPGSGTAKEIPSGDEITLGVSAAFSGPSRGLGRELYRGAKAYFDHCQRKRPPRPQDRPQAVR